MWHLQLTIWFCLIGGDFRDCLVLGEPERYRQSRLFHDGLAQFMRPLVTSEKTIHSCDVDVMLIDARLLVNRGFVGYYLRHEARVAAVELHVAADEHRLRAQLFCQPHRLRRVHAETSRLVAACGDDAAVTHTANYHRTTLQRRVNQALHRHEKSVEIKM